MSKKSIEIINYQKDGNNDKQREENRPSDNNAMIEPRKLEAHDSYVDNKRILRRFYEKYKNNYETYLSQHQSIVDLVMVNATQSKIKAKDYISSRELQSLSFRKELTRLPYVSKRKIHNDNARKEYVSIAKAAVAMRRIEYSNTFIEDSHSDANKPNNSIIKTEVHYDSQPNIFLPKHPQKSYDENVLIIQRYFRGYFFRKLYLQIAEMNRHFSVFITSIKCAMIKKVYKFLITHMRNAEAKKQKDKGIQIKPNKPVIENNYSTIKHNDSNENKNRSDMYRHKKIPRKSFNLNNIEHDMAFEYDMNRRIESIGIQVETDEDILKTYQDEHNQSAFTVDDIKLRTAKPSEIIDMKHYPTLTDLISSRFKKKKIIVKYDNLKNQDIITKEGEVMFVSDPDQSKDSILSFLTQEVPDRQRPHLKPSYYSKIVFNEKDSHTINQAHKQLKNNPYDKDRKKIKAKTVQKGKLITEDEEKHEGKGIIKTRVMNGDKVKEGYHSKTSSIDSYITKKTVNFSLKKLILLQRFIKSKLNCTGKKKNIVSRIQRMFIQIIKNKIVSNSKRSCLTQLKAYYRSSLDKENSKATIVEDYNENDDDYRLTKKHFEKITEGLSTKLSKVIVTSSEKLKCSGSLKPNKSELIIINPHPSDLDSVIENDDFLEF